MILDPTDQRIRDEGFNFVPFNRYLASPFQMPESQTVALPSSGGITTLPMNMGGGGGGGTYTGGINDLITDYDKITKENYFSNQPTPLVDGLYQTKVGKTFMGFPSYREQELTGPDLGEYIGGQEIGYTPGGEIGFSYGTDVPLELTTAGKIQGGIESFRNKAGSFMDKIGGFGPVSFIANALDRFDTLSPSDQEFIKMNMGYTGPTVFGDNQSGLSKDVYGINTRSLFGNYAEYVGDAARSDLTDEEYDALTDFQKTKVNFYRQKQKELQQIREAKAKADEAAAMARAQNISRQDAQRQQQAIDRDFRDTEARGKADLGSSYDEGTYCFDPDTLIQMADGSEKKIKEIQLGDNTKGGEVTGVFQFKASDEIHDYKGVIVAGSHYVKEDGKFIMVKDSPISVKIDKIPVVYSLDTTGRRIFIKDIEFADYNGDGVAKNFLTNAGVDLTGFDKEVLRQVENRLI
jgi:hypothetical protein